MADTAGKIPTPYGDEPKKYIRTFAGDMETLEKGGTPNLAPLAEPPSPGKDEVAPAPKETLKIPTAAPSIQTRAPTPAPLATRTPIPAPAPQPNHVQSAAAIVARSAPLNSLAAPYPILTPKPPLIPGSSLDDSQPEKYIRTFAGDMEILSGGGVPNLTLLKETHPAPSERLVAASPIATTSVISILDSLPKTPLPAPVERPLVTPIQTYEGDFSQRVKETNASTATILAAEQDRGGQPVVEVGPEKTSKSGLVYVISGVTLLIAGITGAYFAYLRYAAVLAPIVLAPTVSAPIFVDEREEISGAGPALLLAVEQSVTRALSPNAVRLLYIASSTTKSVFTSLPLSAPDILLRNVRPEGSMAGVVNVGGNQSPFFILSVLSYGDTFSGMLSWEALMPRVLAALFPSTLQSAVTTSTATTTTIIKPAPAPLASQLAFQDEVVSNHDVRIYRDATGGVVLLYGYWNQSTLVIARSLVAFTEILQRLATSRAP
jgi:hypothetical protein